MVRHIMTLGRKNNIIKISLSPKLIYNLNAITVRIRNIQLRIQNDFKVHVK